MEAAVFLAVMANLLWDEWMGMEKSLAGTGRIELPAFGFGDRCSACLSYAPIEIEMHRGHPGVNTGGLYGNRTRDNILDREVLYQLS